MDDIKLNKADVRLIREHKKCSMDYILRHLDDAGKDPVGFARNLILGLINEVQIEEGVDILSSPSVFTGKIPNGNKDRKQVEHG
ncbi:MAG: hypothetical protein IMZ47_03100 [Firmicutes bacterium]|nr:hypothetical protein [Bacillota bacterium]